VPRPRRGRQREQGRTWFLIGLTGIDWLAEDESNAPKQRKRGQSPSTLPRRCACD
jgi:hypothetical protein